MDDISLTLNPNLVCNNMLQLLSSHICPHLTLDWISFMLKTLLVDFHHEPKALFKNLRKLQQGFREIFFCWDASGSCLARIILAKKQGWPWFPLSYGLMGGGSPVGTRLLQAILFSRKQYEWTDAYLNFSGSQKAAYFVINHTAPDVRKIYPKATKEYVRVTIRDADLCCRPCTWCCVHAAAGRRPGPEWGWVPPEPWPAGTTTPRRTDAPTTLQVEREEKRSHTSDRDIKFFFVLVQIGAPVCPTGPENKVHKWHLKRNV